MGRSKRLPILENIRITDVAAEGKAIARHEGMIVFVRQAVPGDVVDVQLIRKRKKFSEGIVVKFHRYSERRAEPFCQHFGTCGGCIWQHLPYEDQLKYKQQQVVDSLQRIGKVEVKALDPVIASPKQMAYRNKLEYTFSSKRWLTQEEIQSGIAIKERRALGFHIPGKFDKVFNVETCFLQPEPSNAIRNFVRDYGIMNDLDFFDLVKQDGLLRNLTVRNTKEGEFMVVVSFFRNEIESIEKLLSAIASSFPQIVSLYYVINSKGNDTISDLELILFKGKDCLEETMEELRFRISPKSFFQTNFQQAYHLYCIVRDFAGLSGSEIVYDLYTGTGIIAIFLARHCTKVIGMDYVGESIADAKMNAELNRINNAYFFTGDIRHLLDDSFVDEQGRPDVVITDPPRAGMNEDVVCSILKVKPARIVYVSCNPATQARDIEILSEQYELVRSQPVDMFPHTAHVENVVLLRKKSL